MIKLDVTGNRFDELVDMDYSHLWVGLGSQIPEELCINISALKLHLSKFEYDFEKELSSLPINTHQSNLYIHGNACLRVANPVLVEVRVSLYEPNSKGSALLRDSTGETIKLRRKMQTVDVSTSLCHQYDIGGMLMWPYGDCDITVKSQGVVSIEFSEDDCISGEEFDKDFDKWIKKSREV